MTTTSNTKLLLADDIMALVVSTKGRWVKIQRADRTPGELSNISFAEADIATVKYDNWYTAQIEAEPNGEPAAYTEETTERKNGIVNAKYLDKYTKVTLANGATVKDNGDDAAQMLRGLELEEVYDVVATKLGFDAGVLEERYSHLNPGQQRMNLGNRLRKALRDADAAHAAQ